MNLSSGNTSDRILSCLLFKLPVEVRRLIYRQCYQEVDVHVIYNRLPEDSTQVTKRGRYTMYNNLTEEYDETDFKMRLLPHTLIHQASRELALEASPILHAATTRITLENKTEDETCLLHFAQDDRFRDLRFRLVTLEYLNDMPHHNGSCYWKPIMDACPNLHNVDLASYTWSSLPELHEAGRRPRLGSREHADREILYMMHPCMNMGGGDFVGSFWIGGHECNALASLLSKKWKLDWSVTFTHFSNGVIGSLREQDSVVVYRKIYRVRAKPRGFEKLAKICTMDVLCAHWFEGMSEHVTAEAGSAEWHETTQFLADVPPVSNHPQKPFYIVRSLRQFAERERRRAVGDVVAEHVP